MGMTKITAFDAVTIAVSGLAVVFVVLAVICFIIVIISKVLSAKDSKRESEFPKAINETSKNSEDKNTAYVGEVALIGVDEKTAACIMAIVSHETGIPLSELVFKKIRAI